MTEFQRWLDYMILALKYYIEGDDWGDAKIFARRIVYGWRDGR